MTEDNIYEIRAHHLENLGLNIRFLKNARAVDDRQREVSEPERSEDRYSEMETTERILDQAAKLLNEPE